MSKCGSGSGSTRTDLRQWEYKKSPLLQLLGFSRHAQSAHFRSEIRVTLPPEPLMKSRDFSDRVKDLGRKARRLLEEGRMRYLRERGFDARLVRYCGADVTSDNLAIIAQRS